MDNVQIVTVILIYRRHKPIGFILNVLLLPSLSSTQAVTLTTHYGSY
jgi:hypothetical protein